MTTYIHYNNNYLYTIGSSTSSTTTYTWSGTGYWRSQDSYNSRKNCDLLNLLKHDQESLMLEKLKQGIRKGG